MALANAGIEDDVDLAVGVRGTLLYEKIYIGKFSSETEKSLSLVTDRTKDTGRLEAFFKGAPESEPEPALGEEG
ncbi:MAG: hypothetical protein ACI8XO_005104 [Verrucomicrobiales bacterium]